MPDAEDAYTDQSMEATFRDLREPLGELVLQFAHLEDQVTMTIDALLRLTYQEGAVLETVIRDFGSRIRLFRALVVLNVKDDDLKKLGRRVFGLLRQANLDRNDLLHDAWNGYSPEHDTLGKIKFSINDIGELAQEPLHRVTLQVIRDTVSYVQRVGILVADWRSRFNRCDLPHVALDPLPDKWYKGSPLRSHMKRKN